MIEKQYNTLVYFVGKAECIGLNRDEQPAYTLTDFSVWLRLFDNDLDITAQLDGDLLSKCKAQFLSDAKADLRDPWEVASENKAVEAQWQRDCAEDR